jgi:hypothetical protein
MPRRQLTKLTGYGILLDKNVEYKDTKMLLGIFQHLDYWDNNIFELGTMAFGPGVISNIPISAGSNLYSSLHLGLIALAANNTRFGPQETEVRDYNYGDGLEGKFESGLEIGKRVTVSFLYYYYWIHTYFGFMGDNYIGIMKPNITLKIFNKMSIGFENQVYNDKRFPSDFKNSDTTKTEQRIFLSFYLEDFMYRRK